MDTVVEIRIPPERLVLQRLPANEDVVGLITLENELEPLLELTSLLGVDRPVVVSPAMRN